MPIPIPEIIGGDTGGVKDLKLRGEEHAYLMKENLHCGNYLYWVC
jgi:hypothetical protein